MARIDANRNLLFGVLALQMDFISREALIAATSAWVLDKTRPLNQILVDQGALAADEQALLEPLVRKHLEQHGGDAERSLAAVGSVTSIRSRSPSREASRRMERATSGDTSSTSGSITRSRIAAAEDDGRPVRGWSRGGSMSRV